MKISLLYIVKNEAEVILRSILSCKAICDEIVVIDTGSTDNTVELVESQGAQVYHFDWTGNYSDARNYALTKVTGDWVLFMDADEWFTININLVKEAIEKADKLGKRFIHVRRLEYIKGRLETEGPIVRIMKRVPELQYINRVHEIPANITERNSYRDKVLKINHDGHPTVDTIEKFMKYFPGTLLNHLNAPGDIMYKNYHTSVLQCNPQSDMRNLITLVDRKAFWQLVRRPWKLFSKLQRIQLCRALHSYIANSLDLGRKPKRAFFVLKLFFRKSSMYNLLKALYYIQLKKTKKVIKYLNKQKQFNDKNPDYYYEYSRVEITEQLRRQYENITCNNNKE